MDLLGALRSKLDVLPGGTHRDGLQAVLRHIETAFRHFTRGQEVDDDTAFTDAVFRTNQAFEGGIKEAYRVLTGKDPQRLRPFDIEAHLESTKVFRPRVLAQFTAYRREWRNPSTHDYTLDFDENEAFLAITTVAAFTHLLLDQVAERLAEKAAREEVASTNVQPHFEVVAHDDDPLDKIVPVLLAFAKQAQARTTVFSSESEAQFTGAMAGFLKGAIPSADVQIEVELRAGSSRHYADMVVSLNGQPVVVGLKRTRESVAVWDRGVARLARYLSIGRWRRGVLFILPRDGGAVGVRSIEFPESDARVVLIGPNVSSFTPHVNGR